MRLTTQANLNLKVNNVDPEDIVLMQKLAIRKAMDMFGNMVRRPEDQSEQGEKGQRTYIAPIPGQPDNPPQNFYDSEFRRAQALLNSKRTAGLWGQLGPEDLQYNQDIDDEVNRIYTDMHKYNQDGSLINPDDDPRQTSKMKGITEKIFKPNKPNY